jgi:hypothetical protein
MQEQYVTVTVFDQNETKKKVVEVPLSMKMGAFKKAVREALTMDANLPCILRLKRTGTEMNDEDTFKTAGIQDKDVFKLLTNNPGG